MLDGFARIFYTEFASFALASAKFIFAQKCGNRCTSLSDYMVTKRPSDVNIINSNYGCCTLLQH